VEDGATVMPVPVLKGTVPVLSGIVPVLSRIVEGMPVLSGIDEVQLQCLDEEAEAE